jgi:hypothetical protein
MNFKKTILHFYNLFIKIIQEITKGLACATDFVLSAVPTFKTPPFYIVDSFCFLHNPFSFLLNYPRISCQCPLVNEFSKNNFAFLQFIHKNNLRNHQGTSVCHRFCPIGCPNFQDSPLSILSIHFASYTTPFHFC